MRGAMFRLELGRAPAVIMAASASATRVRADCSVGLKYKAASESVPRSQTFGGHGSTGCPRFASSYACRPGSARFRNLTLEAVSTGTIGAGWYRRTAHPAKNKTPKRTTTRFLIAYIECCTFLNPSIVIPLQATSLAVEDRPEA